MSARFPLTVFLLELQHTDASIPADWLATLSPQEQQRAATFKHAERRARYIAAHALAYYAVQSCSDLSAGTFTIASDGAPLITPIKLTTTVPQISLSHSGNRIACVINSTGEKTGCDIEIRRERPNALAIARHFFTDSEYQQLCNCADDAATQQLFYRMWTAKEAWLKAQGLGIANGLKKLALVDQRLQINDATSTHHWQIDLYESNAFTLAVATKNNRAENNYTENNCQENIYSKNNSAIKTVSWHNGRFVPTDATETLEITVIQS